MKIVTVVPFKKGILGEDLTYFTAQNIPNGSIVSISLRNKKILGLVVNVADASHAKSEIKNASSSVPLNSTRYELVLLPSQNSKWNDISGDLFLPK